MQEFTLDPKRFAHSLSAGVDDLVKSEEFRSIHGEFTRWTRALKQWLTEEGKNRGFRTLCTDGLGTHEFMLDLVWWKDGPGGSAVLACESEFGNPRYSRGNSGLVAEDFEKLLSFKAPFKLLVFDSYSNPEIQRSVIAELESYLRDYEDHRGGEQYLVMDMSVVLAAWLCTIAKDGVDTSLFLDRLI